MGKTSIEWCDYSWPIANGCRRVSPGCGGASGVGGCYAERLISTRLSKTPKYQGLAVFGEHGPRWTGDARFWMKSLTDPVLLRAPSRIFVADMGDLFFEKVTNEEIALVYAVASHEMRHTFQILTKRPERAAEWYEWLTGEAYKNHDPIVFGKSHHTMGRFEGGLLSHRLDDAIGEHFPGFRVRSIRDQCVAAHVPFFFKQWGGVRKKAAGRTLDLRTWDEMPAVSR